MVQDNRVDTIEWHELYGVCGVCGVVVSMDEGGVADAVVDQCG